MASPSHSSKSGNVNFKILSLNVRGLYHSKKKRRALFRQFHRNKYDIICVQEAHLTRADSRMLSREWGSAFHMAEGSHRSKGLLTLFGKNFTEPHFSVVKESDRCLISKIKFDDSEFFVVNVYAPCVPAEKPLFFNDIASNISDLQLNDDSNLILLGDFNTVFNKELDNIAGIPHSDGIINTFRNLINTSLLVDIWRESHGIKKEYTWCKHNPHFIARRLDYIFVSERLVPFSKDPSILQLGFSDHKAVFVNIDFSSFKRGPSSFKFNTSLLHEKVLVDKISSEIDRIKHLDMDPHLKWEYIKASIKDIGCRFGRHLAHTKRKNKQNFERQINELESHIALFPNDIKALKVQCELKQKLELMAIKEAEGARIRSGQKWAQEGEKCTKYFLNLEKQRSNSNTIFSLIDSTGATLSNPCDILEFIKTHYENIYTNYDNNLNSSADHFAFNNEDIDFLDDTDHHVLNKELTESELLGALKSSNNKSAPGNDGLPAEIYKFFWNSLKEPLLECFKHSFRIGTLCSSQTMGVICLHHKGKGLPRELVGNWRPISLTNFDYKLLAKALAIRLNSCIFKCVGEDQYAFIKGRQIGSLLREIDDMLTFGKTKIPEGIILSLDYAKAFDTLSVAAIMKALKYFGFNDNFLRWIEILLTDRKSCVRNGGYLSEFFHMNRGVRQGCPISPLLFILTLELLARDIRKNAAIKGIKFDDFGNPVKIKMYADDATVFLRDMIDFREVLSRIKMFSNFSGLCLNKSKSAAMRISNVNFDNNIRNGIKFYNRIKILGVIFSNECSASDIAENFDSKIDQLKRLCSLWGKRSLTVMGRITILKSFGISLFIYLMQSIGISDETLKKINLIIHRFIWDPTAEQGKKVTEKVKRVVISKKYEHGGLNMIDITKLQNSFLLKWADMLLDPLERVWKHIPIMAFKKVGGLSAFRSNVASKDFKGLELIKHAFWRRVLKTWLDHKNVNTDFTNNDVHINDPIFNNRFVTFKNQTLFKLRCINKSIIFIKDFFIQGEIMSYDNFNSLFGSSADTMLTYNTLFNAIKRHEVTLLRQFQDPVASGVTQMVFRDLQIGKISRKVFYELISDTTSESVREEWRVVYNINENDADIWCMAHECCKEVVLLDLHWRILHNIYATGVLRKKMKKVTDDKCAFCGELDTLIHFFVSCEISRVVWSEAVKLISCLCGKRISLSEKVKIFGLLKSDTTFNNDLRLYINHVILVCKRTISKFKYEKKGNIKLMFENQIRYRGLDSFS